jgi:very-short-patch-repair endonuclease
MWRLDYCWPDQKLGVELEGGIWTQGRHTRGGGFEADLEKHNHLQLAGWLVLRFTDKHLKDGSAIELTKQALG